MKIKAYVKRPGKAPYSAYISNTLDNLQKTVGGFIETFQFTSDAAIICNEEGKLMGLPYNCRLFGENFVGDIVFVGVDGEDFCDMPIDFKSFKLIFSNLWEG